MTLMTEPQFSSPTGLSSGPASASSAGASLYKGLAAKDERLGWLDLRTVPSVVNRSLRELFTRAMEQDRDAKRVAQLLLNLWSPSQYHLDLNELGFLDHELNYACRHVLNFVIALQANFRDFVTAEMMAPVLANWGGPEDQR